MQQQNPYMAFRQEAPQAAEAFDGLLKAVCATEGLDAKTRQLIYIGIKAAQGDAAAVAAHVPMARQEGATREEIRGAIVLTLTVSGVTGVLHCLGPALETYDRVTERRI
jgi:AhpD family alkylhydroperoxidase